MFESICRAMSEPEFYPHDATGLERRDTHISTVFLAGPWAYKLKKPVKFDFLDFLSLDDRRFFCEREVLLNQRLSRGIYHDVVGIYQDDQGGFSLMPGGMVVEYAVKMTRLPDNKSLSALIRRVEICVDHITTLGRMLAAFYEKAEHGSHQDEFGKRELISLNMEENFAGIEPFVGKGLFDGERWEFIRQVCRSFLKDHGDLFDRRIAAGRIRDGHGDLRCEHVYYHDGIQVIDCIEFNERFRYGDAALDLSFLVMDLDHLGCPDLGRELVSSYAISAADVEIYQLLDFYAAYRALVRLKVSCFSIGQNRLKENAFMEREIRRYLNQAYFYALLFGRPTLWVFFGLPASGKSTLAGKTAEALSLPVFHSDVERKKGLKKSSRTRASFNEGIYRTAFRTRVYSRLISLAQERLAAGGSVILDATFLEPKWRKWIGQLAEDMDADLVWVQCVCKHQTSISRLQQRELDPGESDARLSHFLEMEKRAVPFAAENPDTHFVVDTDQVLNRSLVEVLSQAYSAKRAQIKSLA
jgi:aminoglycoside phosphotransferase family enzyme/predicted kinase